MDPSIRFQAVRPDEQQSEMMTRQSLSYWQDCWQRLWRNKTAIVSLVVIIIIILSAILFPIFWPYTYDQQNLAYANVPPFLQLYKIDENHYIYISNDFKAIQTDSEGNLLGPCKMLKDDKMKRMYIYEINQHPLFIDYGGFFRANSQLIKLEANYSKTGEIPVQAAPFLRDYFKDKDPEIKKVSIDEAKKILEREVKRLEVKYQDQVIEPFKTVSNKTFIWGSDSLGRDLFIRVMYGARMSLLVGVFAAVVNFVVGVIYGGISGYLGGRVDNIMMRIVDTISSIPMMLYVIMLMVVLGPGLHSIIIAMGLTYWVEMARIVRSQVLAMREQEFVMAATLLGVSTRKILTRHLIPNAMGPIMVALTMQIPSAMFTEAFLSFIGLGVSKPKASWGALANAALPGLYVNPYQLFFPALIMSITILALNLFSDGLRDSLDPMLRK